MTPGNVRIDVQTSSFSALAEGPVQQEPWFGMPYITKPISEGLLTQWGSTPPPPELRLPPQNDFLPTDFSLRSDETATASTSSSTPAADMHQSKRITGSQASQNPPVPSAAQVGQKHAQNGSAITTASNGGSRTESDPNSLAAVLAPDLVCSEPGLRLWHKLDRQFQTPKAAAYFFVTSAAMYQSPRAAATMQLILKLLEDALCETAYLADVAGLSYDVSLPLPLPGPFPSSSPCGRCG